MDKHWDAFYFKMLFWCGLSFYRLLDLENNPLSLVFPSDSWIKITSGIAFDTECQCTVQKYSPSPWSFNYLRDGLNFLLYASEIPGQTSSWENILLQWDWNGSGFSANGLVLLGCPCSQADAHPVLTHKHFLTRQISLLYILLPFKTLTKINFWLSRRI